MSRLLFGIMFLLYLPQILFAMVHSVPYNTRIILDLNDGDTISLTDFPKDWEYSRVVLGINSSPSVQMTGNLIVNHCKYSLYSYYREVAFAYTNEIKIKYSGKIQQRMPIQWWVDNNLTFSNCKNSDKSRLDSIWQMVYDFTDSLYESKISRYQDLGAVNSEIIFEGSSQVFKITNLPTWKYNRLYVQIEPQDGRELNGFVYVGKKKVRLGGWTSAVIISQKTNHAPYLELAFPEYRKIKIKWWATNEQPVETQIKTTETLLENDSILVSYEFEKTPYTSAILNLKFDKNVFSDSQVPTIKKLAFNPRGPENLKELISMGDVFDIQAKLNSNQEITLALPLDFNYVQGRDTVTIGHFIESENRWIEEPVDSIVHGYAYFRAKSLSWRSIFRKACKVANKVAVIAVSPAIGVTAIFSEDVREGIETVASGWADLQTGIVDGVVESTLWLYDIFNELRCFDFDGIKDQFTQLFGYSKMVEWNELEQGTLLGTSKWEKEFTSILNSKQNKNLINITDSLAKNENKIQQENARKITSKNLDILLADAILATSGRTDDKGNTIKRRFTFSNAPGELFFEDSKNPNLGKLKFTDYFLTNSGMLSDASWMVQGLEVCYNAANISGALLTQWRNFGNSIYQLNYQDFCKNITNMYGLDEGYVEDVIECVEFVTNWKSAKAFFDSHIEKLQEISNAMTRISLLAWIDKNFREKSASAYKSVYDGVRVWLELAGPMLLENNLVAKAYGSLALYEFLYYGTHENLDYLNNALKMHYGENGGYSEGSGYSQYIWDDVPYILSALQEAYKAANKIMPAIEEKFLRSPYYMIEFSRPVKNLGYIPIEIDDGCTYNPDYRVWAKLTGDSYFLKWSELYPLKFGDNKIITLTAFGFPHKSIYEAIPSNLPQKTGVWGSFKDGIGIITAIVSNDTISLSMIAEDSQQWKNGQNHDQQDNLSITLSSSKQGFIIQDRGYSGYGNRTSNDIFHRHASHNILTLGSNCNKSSPNESCIDFRAQRDNHIIDVNEIRRRAEAFSGNISGIFWSLLAFLGVHLDLLGEDFKVEGGSEANLLDSLNNKNINSVGFTAIHLLTKYRVNENMTTIANHRSILYFGDNFWVIDRPNEQGMVWLANTPKENWSEVGIHLYGSSQNDLGLDAQSVPRNIPQNSSRSDYPEPDKMLANNWFAIQDDKAKTYVMTYPVNDENFKKVSENCPQEFQCFENTAKNKRLVISPQGVRYRVKDVLNRFSGYPETDGIMLAWLNEKKIWEYDVLDGKTYGEFKKVNTIDLPALRTLLLR